MRLEAQDIGWTSRGRRIVGPVSIAFDPGETFGLVGPNGSGKSTLLRLLAGLAPKPTGTVRLDGTDMTSLGRRAVAQRIAVVEQMADTAEALRVRDVAELGRTPILSALRPFGDADRAIVDQALAAVEMAGMADRMWSTLSGGERQRVQIARALAQQPRILILDEPTNHLDIHHQLALLRLVSDLPITVIMALHDLNQAMGCDRLGVMQDGLLMAHGTPSDVLGPRRIARVFRVGATALCDPADGSPVLKFYHQEETHENHLCCAGSAGGDACRRGDPRGSDVQPQRPRPDDL